MGLVVDIGGCSGGGCMVGTLRGVRGTRDLISQDS